MNFPDELFKQQKAGNNPAFYQGLVYKFSSAPASTSNAGARKINWYLCKIVKIVRGCLSLAAKVKINQAFHLYVTLCEKSSINSASALPRLRVMPGAEFNQCIQPGLSWPFTAVYSVVGASITSGILPITV